MNFYLEEFFPSGFFEGLQTFIIALFALLVGWLLAVIIAGAVERAFRKLKLNEKNSIKSIAVKENRLIIIR